MGVLSKVQWMIGLPPVLWRCRLELANFTLRCRSQAASIIDDRNALAEEDIGLIVRGSQSNFPFVPAFPGQCLVSSRRTALFR